MGAPGGAASRCQSMSRAVVETAVYSICYVLDGPILDGPAPSAMGAVTPAASASAVELERPGEELGQARHVGRDDPPAGSLGDQPDLHVPGEFDEDLPADPARRRGLGACAHDGGGDRVSVPCGH